MMRPVLQPITMLPLLFITTCLTLQLVFLHQTLDRLPTTFIFGEILHFPFRFVIAWTTIQLVLMQKLSNFIANKDGNDKDKCKCIVKRPCLTMISRSQHIIIQTCAPECAKWQWDFNASLRHLLVAARCFHGWSDVDLDSWSDGEFEVKLRDMIGISKFEQVNHYATVDRMDAVRYFTPVGEEVVWRIEDAEVPEDTTTVSTISTTSTPDTTSTSIVTANAQAPTVTQAIQTTLQPNVSPEQGHLQDAQSALIHETRFVLLRSPSASDTTWTATAATHDPSMNLASYVTPQLDSTQFISNSERSRAAPNAPSQEAGFLLLRASILKRNTDPATKKRETTVHAELLSYSSLNHQFDGGETRPVFVRRFVVEKPPATSTRFSESHFTSSALIKLSTDVSTPIPSVNGKKETLQFWKKLGIVEKAYYTPYLNHYHARLEDYKTQKKLWKNALQRYPWSPTISARFPTWAHCEPQFLCLGEDVAAFCDALNEWRLYSSFKKAQAALKKAEEAVNKYIVPEVKGAVAWDRQVAARKAERDAYRKAAAVVKEELAVLAQQRALRRATQNISQKTAAVPPTHEEIAEADRVEKEVTDKEEKEARYEAMQNMPGNRLIYAIFEDEEDVDGVPIHQLWEPRMKAPSPEVLSEHNMDENQDAFAKVFMGHWHFEADELHREFIRVAKMNNVRRPRRTSAAELVRVRQMLESPCQNYEEDFQVLKTFKTFAEFERQFGEPAMDDLHGCLCNEDICSECNPPASNTVTDDQEREEQLEPWEFNEIEVAKQLEYERIERENTMNVDWQAITDMHGEKRKPNWTKGDCFKEYVEPDKRPRTNATAPGRPVGKTIKLGYSTISDFYTDYLDWGAMLNWLFQDGHPWDLPMGGTDPTPSAAAESDPNTEKPAEEKFEFKLPMPRLEDRNDSVMGDDDNDEDDEDTNIVMGELLEFPSRPATPRPKRKDSHDAEDENGSDSRKQKQMQQQTQEHNPRIVYIRRPEYAALPANPMLPVVSDFSGIDFPTFGSAEKAVVDCIEVPTLGPVEKPIVSVSVLRKRKWKVTHADDEEQQAKRCKLEA